MLKIRMQRIGRINQPAYRMVVTEHTAAPQAGKIVEKVGTYEPRAKTRVLDTERIKYWLSVGAKPSDTVHNMLVAAGIIKADKKLPIFKKPEAPAAEAEAEAPAAAPAAEAEAAETPAAEEAPSTEAAAA